MSHMESAHYFAETHWLLKHGKGILRRVNATIDMSDTSKIWFLLETVDFFIDNNSTFEVIEELMFVKISTSRSDVSIYINADGFYIEQHKASLPFNPSNILLAYTSNQTGNGNVIVNDVTSWDKTNNGFDLEDMGTLYNRVHCDLITMYQLLLAFSWHIDKPHWPHSNLSDGSGIQYMRHPEGTIKYFFLGEMFSMSVDAFNPKNFRIKYSPKQIKLSPKHHRVFHTEKQSKLFVKLQHMGITMNGTFLMYGLGEYYSNQFKQRLGETIYQSHKMLTDLDDALLGL
ncbi:hypothetical protein phiOC_p312 [Ochrobactrum phage vB_OspM_OC]|nr:hypothetical protein phiOC_p312 [Ochrobactrum phage vB_OspM_OC]